MRAELFHADRRTDITKLIALFAILRKRLKVNGDERNDHDLYGSRGPVMKTYSLVRADKTADTLKKNAIG